MRIYQMDSNLLRDVDLSQFVPIKDNRLLVYTSQFRYSGDRRLDITAINGSDLFRPDWEEVKSYKAGNMSEKEYTEYYHKKMQNSYKHYRAGWNRLLKCDWVVLVCFCKANTFCHRYLLADYLVKCGAKYEGELPP